MGILIFSPPDFLDSEPTSQAQYQQIESTLFTNLSLNKKDGKPLNSHSLKNTLYFNIEEKGNFIVFPIVQRIPKLKVGYHVIDKDRCLLVKSVLDTFSINNNRIDFKSFSNPGRMTPWTLEWSFPTGTPIQVRRELMHSLQKVLLRENIPVIIPKHRYLCHTPLPKGLVVEKGVVRSHRIAKVEIKDWDLEKKSGTVTLSSLSSAFGHVNSKENSVKINLDTGITKEIVNWFQKGTYLFNTERVFVKKRFARWVFLNVGREYGLRIGTHLVGAQGEKLHVIHFATSGLDLESAVALIRWENRLSPIKKGDSIELDKTKYPLQ